MTDFERDFYIKQTCFEDWQHINTGCDDYYNTGKAEYRWWCSATPDDLDDWSVGDTPLADVVTQPETWLVLRGLYAPNEDAYWGEDD